MAVTYATTLKTTRMTAVVTAMDGGSGNAVLELGTAAMATVLCSITLAKPSATVSGAVLTFAGLPKSGTGAAAAGAGTNAVAARIKDSAGNVIVDGLTVGTSGADIIVDNASIATGQTVNFTATSTITHG
jgi:hypothetical protein